MQVSFEALGFAFHHTACCGHRAAPALKAGELAVVEQMHVPGTPLPVLGNTQQAVVLELLAGVRVGNYGPVDEAHNVGVLLNRARVAQVLQPGHLPHALCGAPVHLR